MTKSPRKTNAAASMKPTTRPLTEGYIQKGGQNPAISKIKVRPPAPRPISTKPVPSSSQETEKK